MLLELEVDQVVRVVIPEKDDVAAVFAKAQLQYDLWRRSQKKRRTIKPLVAALASR